MERSFWQAASEYGHTTAGVYYNNDEWVKQQKQYVRNRSELPENDPRNDPSFYENPDWENHTTAARKRAEHNKHKGELTIPRFSLCFFPLQ